jgi:rhodanese-related sulfurtransferase
MKILTLSLLAAVLLVPGLSRADDAAPKLHLIHVADLTALQQQKDAKLQVLDANTEDFRAANGVIPGAKLLTSSSRYDVAKELPQDKATALVFYCANPRCLASHGAAERAIKAGYSKVSVLADGLLGWKAAGQPTAKPSR